MNTIEIIMKKRDSFALTKEEICFMIDGYVENRIPDYQMSAFLMAIYIQGMNDEETFYLTKCMMQSGDILDLSSLNTICVDKHSTGGVGDKTTLVLAPMLAACGVCVAKMSGRGLSHTGGTLDKLESIPHFNVTLSTDAFLTQLKDIGLAVIGQSDNLVVADKLLYALRDVTGTVSSIPLIASSIMSKKLAAGCDVILLDVKFGDGAFMKTKEEALVLAQAMEKIGIQCNRHVKYEITDMNQPLGCAIGNTLEVIEAIETLQGRGPQDFVALCMHSGVTLLLEAKKAKTREEAISLLEEVIHNGKALAKLKEMVSYQNGDVRFIEQPQLFKKATHLIEIVSNKSGFVSAISCTEIGLLACELGAGRQVKSDSIVHEVGIIVRRKVGDFVSKGDVLCVVHSHHTIDEKTHKGYENCFVLQQDKVEIQPIIYQLN